MHKKKSEGPWLTGCSPSRVFNVLKMKTKHRTCGREWLQYLSGKKNSLHDCGGRTPGVLIKRELIINKTGEYSVRCCKLITYVTKSIWRAGREAEQCYNDIMYVTIKRGMRTFEN